MDFRSFCLFQGDYDVVINDYEKAKSLFGNTEVPVFKKGIYLKYLKRYVFEPKMSSYLY